MPTSAIAAHPTEVGYPGLRFGNSTTLGGAPATSYLCPEHVEGASDATERVWVVPSAGTLRALYGHTSAAHGQAAETVTLTVRINGAPTSMVVVFGVATTDVADTAHTAAVVAGDRVSVSCVTTAVLAVLANISVGISLSGG